MRSLNKNKLPFVILSAELSGKHFTTNEERTESLETSLKALNFSFKKVLGMYKGSQEVSFMVPMHGATGDINSLISLAKHFQQESILSVDADRKASLVFMKGQTESIGTWQDVSEGEARRHDSFTYDIETDSYFIVR